MSDYNELLKSITDYLYEQNVRSDCGIESLASDLIEIAAKPFYKQYVDVINKPENYFPRTIYDRPRTDYDRMCSLLRDIDCKYTTDETMESGNILTIEIDSESIISFGGVVIDFYDDGSFKGFVACE